ncbi:DUF2141 domain-containing protein [Terricaulis sp.]|uniref:DUF2141 domain-containing protein n=1 Tax=Terricaulis sp. TaxID=2768686 RepID=UPI00378323F4
MLKFTALAACSVALAVVLAPQFASAEPVALNVHVANVRPGGGEVRAALYDQDHWLATPVDAEAVAGDRATVIVPLRAPNSGRYGIALYQDRNGDGQLNRGVFGMPTEPFAFSNAASASFGPPAFASAAFDVAAGAPEVTITLP